MINSLCYRRREVGNDVGLFYLIGWGVEFGGRLISCFGVLDSIKEL